MTSIDDASPARVSDNYLPSYEIRSYRLPAKVFHWLTAILVVGMVASGVLAKQLDGDPIADVLFGLHKLTGVLTFLTVVLRLIYRVAGGIPKSRTQPHRRPVLHWLLYAVVFTVPLLGWTGASDYNIREIVGGYSLPAIWPQDSGYGDLLLHAHAYFAFTLLALIALHIGIAIKDYMTDARPPSARRR
jgi:cytochrome b561